MPPNDKGMAFTDGHHHPETNNYWPAHARTGWRHHDGRHWLYKSSPRNGRPLERSRQAANFSLAWVSQAMPFKYQADRALEALRRAGWD